jgi:hypothetical protein
VTLIARPDHSISALKARRRLFRPEPAQQFSGGSRERGDTTYYQKRPDLPADSYKARATLAHSKLRKQFVDIPVGEVKLHTWIEYPAVEGKAGTVIVMQHGAGMDDWVRVVADQLAQFGFLAVAPDVWSGTGPGGGGLDSFQFVDDAMKASVN